MHRMRIIVLGLAVLVVASGVPGLTEACLRVGPAPARQAYVGVFAVENPTSVAIPYEVKWGNGQWKSFTVQPGTSMRHSYPLDQSSRAPAPYIKYDNVGGDGRFTAKEYELDFRKVGNGQGTPQAYKFRYGQDRRSLYLETAR